MENALCITMDYHPKGDLFTYLAQNGSLAENEASEITNQVLKGLEIMYEEGFVHRDIKPQVGNQNTLSYWNQRKT